MQATASTSDVATEPRATTPIDLSASTDESRPWMLVLPHTRFFWSVIDDENVIKRASMLSSAFVDATLDELVEPDMPLGKSATHSEQSRRLSRRALDMTAGSDAISDNESHSSSASHVAQATRDESMSLHVVYLHVETTQGPRLVACACPRLLLNELPSLVLVLAPDAYPAFIAAKVPSEAQTINLLIGRQIPRTLRLQNTKRTIVIAASVAIVAAFASFGLHRRASAQSSLTEHTRQATSRIVRNAVPSIPTEWPATVKDLQEELHRVQLTREQPLGISSDASLALRDLLGGWPKVDGVQVQSMNVTDSRATLSFTASSIETAQSCLSAWVLPAGWKLDEPQLSVQGENAFVRVTVQRAEQNKSTGAANGMQGDSP